jgi:hypothetical protein
MNTRELERQIEIAKELAELLGQQLEATGDSFFLGRDKVRDDASSKRSERIRALRRELSELGKEKPQG